MTSAGDRIRLTGIRAHGRHGIYAFERENGQEFVADVDLHLPLGPAAAGDDIGATVHYGELAEEVAAILAGDPAGLIETVAERIAAAALAHDIVDAVTVTVHKPSAPIAVPFDDVSVTIHRGRRS